MLTNKFLSFGSIYQLSLFVALPLLCYCLVRIFKRLRRRFPIRANCWFCNQNTTLPYDERNSFKCPSCNQYNGFTEEGDYNKVIPEQQDELLNFIVSPRKLHSAGPSNGLCQICNNNQQLKIYQLANFVPLNEDNYDVEIEHFQKQLEKAYKLCSSCNYTVKCTIAKRNCTLLGKQIEEIRKSGKTLLNQSTTTKQTTIKLRWYALCSIMCASLLIMYFMDEYHEKMKQLGSEVVVLVQIYSRELIFTVTGSLLTVMYMQLRRGNPTISPLFDTGAMKKEKFSIKETSASYLSTSSYAQSRSDASTDDLSYASFKSPLNSTVSSYDSGSVCTELERLTSNMPSCAHNHPTVGDELRLDVPNNTFILRKSPSAPSMYTSFNTVRSHSSFAPSPKSPMKITPHLQQLHLGTAETKRPILSPAKFRNPWTGKPWDIEISSRSSSQSSGVYSRATSVCGDEVASLTVEQNLYKNASLQPYNLSFNTIDNIILPSNRY